MKAEDIYEMYPKAVGALTKVIAAWEALPMGHYSAREIERWMHDHMKPAIDKAREVMHR